MGEVTSSEEHPPLWARDGLALEELGGQVEGARHEAESMEHHGLNSLSDTHGAFGGPDERIEDGDELEVVTNPSDEPKVIRRREEKLSIHEVLGQ